MELAIYTCRTDALLFVPAVCLPSREAEETFGPLRCIGRLALGEAQLGPWQDILRQIERHLFATLPMRHAALLMDALPAEAVTPAVDA